jgi:hypothetical protein
MGSMMAAAMMEPTCLDSGRPSIRPSMLVNSRRVRWPSASNNQPGFLKNQLDHRAGREREKHKIFADEEALLNTI